MKAEKQRKIPAGRATELMERFGETAIHLGTRHYLMKQAIRELQAALLDVYNLIPEPWSIAAARGFRVVRGADWDKVRDRTGVGFVAAGGYSAIDEGRTAMILFKRDR